MLNAEISGKLMVMNEPVSRILMAMQLQTTPEVMQSLQKELENVQKEMESYKKEREKAVLKNDGIGRFPDVSLQPRFSDTTGCAGPKRSQ